jgi:hypothetical protein
MASLVSEALRFVTGMLKESLSSESAQIFDMRGNANTSRACQMKRLRWILGVPLHI